MIRSINQFLKKYLPRYLEEKLSGKKYGIWRWKNESKVDRLH